nr:sulfite exporter TauE/SafE family protein [Robiginitalea sp. SC105]
MIWLALAFFVIALLYASAGFGGGSSYLAILSLSFTEFYEIRTLALLCNLVVVSGSVWLFYRKGYLDWKLCIPFTLASIPMAYIGASFRLEESLFFGILGSALIVSSLALGYQSLRQQFSEPRKHRYARILTYVLGGAIGMLSGLVGIGGGIFLAPVLNHLRWDLPIKIAALASFFILVNSISGIAGLLTAGTFSLTWLPALALILAVLAGGQIGIRLTLNRLTAQGIRLVTAVLVLVVGVRVLFINGLGLNF